MYPTVVRDGANMRWLDAERTRLQAELDRELAAHPNPNVPAYGIRADQLRRKISDLDKIRGAVDKPNTYLIGLDTSGTSRKPLYQLAIRMKPTTSQSLFPAWDPNRMQEARSKAWSKRSR